MTCHEFEHWLDGGQPSAHAAAAAQHRASCRSCAAFAALDSALAQRFAAQPAAVPANFALRVLQRARTLDAAPPAATPLDWRAIAAQPGILFGCVALAIVLLVTALTLVPTTRGAAASALAALASMWTGAAVTAGGTLAALAAAMTAAAAAVWFALQRPRAHKH